MTVDQLNQFQSICTVDGICYSLHHVIEEVDNEFPEELINDLKTLKSSLQLFRESVQNYVLKNKSIYVDD